MDPIAIERIAITGSSGYYGRHLIRHIRRVAPGVEIMGLDVMPARGPAPHQFAAVDVRSPGLRRVFAEFRPDTVVHLAFVLNPIHDEARMHDININGSRNVFDAVHASRPKRFLVASSATAFGARPDNPLPIDDRWPLRGRTGFKYADDKMQLEWIIGQFADRHPETAVSWVRPSIIYGPGVDNYLSRILLQHPMVVLPDGYDVPQQFVHEDDVVAATWCILSRGGSGPYNLAPPDWIYQTDIARATGRPMITVPLWIMNLLSRAAWRLRLPVLRYPPSLNLYIRYPWIVAPARLCGELGFQFQFSSLETLRALLRSHGKLAADSGSPPAEKPAGGLRRVA